MNRVYKLIWNNARNMYIAVSEIAKSHRKETLRSGKKSVAIFLAALFLCGTGFAANTVQAASTSPVLTDEQKNEIVDKVLEKLNNNENLSKKIQDEVFKYKNKLVFAGGVIGKQNSPSDTPMAFGNGAFANGSDGISLGYQADAFSTKAVSIGARASTLWNGDVAVGNQTHVAGLSAALGSGTELYANQSVALGTQITIVDPEVLELYKKYNYTNPDNKGAVDVPSWYWREQIIKNTPEIQDFKKRYARFLGTLDQDGLDPTYHDELYKQKLIETIMWEKTTKKFSKVTAVGFQSGVKVTGGVALGAFSNATRKSEVIGYNPNGEQYKNVADFLVKNNKKEAYVKALQEQEKLEKEVSGLEKQRKSLNGEKYREISEKAYEKNKESKKASKKVNDLYNAWVSVQGAVAVGNEETGMTRQITGVAAGSEDTDAVNVAQLKALNTKVDNNRKAIEKSGQNGSVKYFSVNPDNNKRTKPVKGSDNSKNDGAYGENSVAIGAFAEAADSNALALGWSVKALGQDSLALGTMVYSYGRNSNAVGNQAAALGEEASAFGNQAKAMDMGTTALGNNAMAIQNGSTAVGYQSLSTISSTSMGTNSFALGQASLALGQRSYIGDTKFRDTYTKYNEEKGNDNNIPGYYISDLINKNDPKIAKYKEQFKDQLQGLDGHNQEAVLRYLIIADLNKGVQFATAVGNHSTVGASQGTALGFYSTVTGAYGTALGYNSVSTAYGAMAAGAYAKANTVGSVAIGFQSKVDNYGGVAIGSEATVGKNGGVALGNKSTADRGSGVVGYVFGADNSTLTKALEAPGNKARFEELKMKIKDEDVSAYNALVTTFKNAAKDSLEKEKAKQEIEKWKAAHPDFLKNVKARKNFENAWQSTYEAVSVGDVEKGITRQITGVAAGSEDTDAVNVAQLKAANSKIENNIKSITNLTTKVEKGGIKYFSVNPKRENLPTANISSDNAANDGATGMESMAIGKGARAAGQQSIVIGQDAVSEHHGGSIVIGQYAKASGDREWHGVVVGSRAEVTGGSGVALGNDSKVTAGGGIALGFGSLADREWNVLGYTPDRNANSLQDRLAGTEYDELVKKLAPLITEHNQLVDDLNQENDSEKKKEKRKKYEAWKAAHPDYDADVKKRDMLKSAWKSGSGAVSVGNSALKATRQIIGVAAGSEDTDAVNVAQLKALNKKVDTNTEKINNLNLKVGKGGVHYFSVKADDSGRPAGTNYDNDGATGNFAIAAGYSSVAAGASSIAVGAQAKSPGNWGVAVGYKASANNISDVAMGINAESSGSWGVAIGGNSQAKGASGIALGQQAKAESQSGIAIGVQSEATGIWGVAIGQNAKAQATTSVAIACRAEAQNENSVAIGNFAKAIGATSTVIGAQATASGTWGTSVGFFAEANSENGTAIGVNSKAKAKKGIALGAYSVADREGRRIGYSLGGDNSTIDNVLESVGLTEKYNQLESVVNPLKDEYKSLVGAFQKAAGGSAEKAAAKEKLKKWEMEHPDFMSATTEMKKILTAWRSGSGALSIGNEEYGITRQITGVAAGSEDTDAVNVAQLKALNTKVDKNVTDITNLKGGFTIKDTATGTVDVTLGETTKSAITFKAETKDDDTTGLFTATVDDQKNVTYTLNTKKLKDQMGLNKLGTGTMSSWKLKVGAESTDISNGSEVTFAASTDEATKGLSVEKKGNVITYGINKSELVGNIAGDIITEINKTTNKITNVDWSKFPGMNFYTQGSVDSGIYTPDVNADNKWNSSHIVFGKGIKVEKFKDKDNNQVTRISLDGIGGTGTNGKDGKSAYEIWRDHEENGAQPNKGKTEQQFLDSLKGKDGKNGTNGKDGTNGTNGKDGTNGTNGKSAYEIWEAHLDKDGTQPNKGKKEQDFLDSLKGKDGVGEDKVEEIKTELKTEITKQMNEFKTESVRGDALGAALSALKPLDYDPYHRSQIMAGVSTYKGQEAIALGLAYYSNENTLLHAGLSYAGSSELMANAGISYKFGSSYDRKLLGERNKLMPQYKGGVISSVYVMQDEMAKLQKENTQLKNEVKEANERTKQIENETNARIAKLEAQIQALIAAR